MNKLKTINLIIYAAVTAFIMINLVGSNALATQGMEVDSLYQETQELKKQNQALEIKINHLTNLSYINQLAQNQGYQRISQIATLDEPGPVAVKPAKIYP